MFSPAHIVTSLSSFYSLEPLVGIKTGVALPAYMSSRPINVKDTYPVVVLSPHMCQLSVVFFQCFLVRSFAFVLDTLMMKSFVPALYLICVVGRLRMYGAGFSSSSPLIGVATFSVSAGVGVFGDFGKYKTQILYLLYMFILTSSFINFIIIFPF